MDPIEMCARRLGALLLAITGTSAVAQQEAVPWTQQRIEAVVRVDIRYAGYPRPATSTGFLVKGLHGYFVLATEHALENEYSTTKLTGAGCVPLTDGTLVLTRGEAAPETLTHKGCAILIGMDLVLIPVEDRSNGYPTLRIVARTMRRLDVLHLAGYANGYAALDTVSTGPVSQLDVMPPDELGVAHLTTSAGMSGGPLLDDDGEVVGVHRGDIYLSPGYAHFARMEKAKALLEPIIGPIETETGSVTAPVEVASVAARSARVGDLLALSSLEPSVRVRAWSSYQSRATTSLESAFLRSLPSPPPTAGPPTTGPQLPAANALTLEKVEVAKFIADARDRAYEDCRKDEQLVNGLIVCGGRHVFLPGVTAGRTITPSLIMLHFAAATNLGGVVRYFTQPEHSVSVHFVIDRDGTLIQLVPADRRASHAGNGIWRGERNLNSRAIGIEFMNAGEINRSSDGKFTTAFGNVAIPENEVLPIKSDDSIRYWHRYTAAQVETAERLAKTLARTYRITDIVGHCNVATGKVDPGPAFPIKAFALAVLGHAGPACGPTSATTNSGE